MINVDMQFFSSKNLVTFNILFFTFSFIEFFKIKSKIPIFTIHILNVEYNYLMFYRLKNIQQKKNSFDYFTLSIFVNDGCCHYHVVP